MNDRVDNVAKNTSTRMIRLTYDPMKKITSEKKLNSGCKLLTTSKLSTFQNKLKKQVKVFHSRNSHTDSGPWN